ncbi:MAG: oxidoreductase, partial [Bacteroidales bacterium]|nr:oxidoreductase [Bacteroidales bacterium]
ASHLPTVATDEGKRTYRTIMVDGSEFEFSEGFTELHTLSYKKILQGEGFGISEAKNCISIVHDIRNATPIGLTGDYHPMAKYSLVKHPFGW